MAWIEGSGSLVRGGAWTFAAGRDFVIALPVATDPAVLTAIAALPRHAITIERLVATVPLLGPSAVSSFAAVVAGASLDGDGVPISVVVRGGIAVQVHSVGGSRRFTDRGIRPWLLADFQSVTGLSIAATDEPAPPFADLGIGGELVTAAAGGGRLDWITGTADEESHVFSIATSAAASAAAGSASASAASSPDAHDTVLRARGGVEDTVLHPERGGPASFDDTVLRQAAEDTVLRPPRESIDGSSTGATAEAGSGGRADENTLLFARRAPGPAPESGADDHAVPTAGAAEVPGETSRFAFRIGDGEARALDAVYLIGRKPRYARVAPADTDVRLIAVPSPTTEVSSTHLELRAQGSAIVITDLRSTNGTVVHPARGRRVRLRPGESLVVAPGARVDIGDGTIIEVFAQTGASKPTSAPVPAPEPSTRRPTT